MTPTLRKVFLICALAFLESLQLLVLCILIFKFIPFGPNPFVQDLWPLNQQSVREERELLFFQFFLVANVFLTALGLRFLKNRLDDKKLFQQLVQFCIWESFWIFVQLYAVFKIIAYDGPRWASVLFYLSFAGSWLFKIFAPEVLRAGPWWTTVVKRLVAVKPQQVWYLALGLSAGVLLWVPDSSYVEARLFVDNLWNSWDQNVLAPALIAKTGWGQWLAFWGTRFGPLSTPGLIQVLGLMSIVYAWSLVWLMRSWLGQPALVGACVLLSIKLQWFHLTFLVPPAATGIFLDQPQLAGLAHPLDLLFLWTLWRHIQGGMSIWLWVAGALAVMSGFISTFDGVMQVVVFVAYVMFVRCPCWALWPLGLSVLWAWILHGNDFWSRGFVQQLFLEWQRFNQTAGRPSWGYALATKNFFSFDMAFVVALVYVLSFAIACWHIQTRKTELTWRLLAILSFYGLLSFTVYAWTGKLNGYYSYAPVAVAIGVFWLHWALRGFKRHLQIAVHLGILIVCVSALLTNVVFLRYPNVLHGAIYPERYRSVYAEHGDIGPDISLVNRLTSAEQKVAIVSSLETKILHEAKRRPLFRHFPLLISTDPLGNQFGGLRLFTTADFQEIMRPLEQGAAPIVFMERKLWFKTIPAAYFQYFPSLNTMMNYVQQHYELLEEGRFLVALKRTS